MSKKKTSSTKKKDSASEAKNEAAASSKDADSIHTAGFPVVGIGASAGGLEALEELLDAMPADTGMAFVIVTHQHPGHTSLLPQLLGKETVMPVVEATDGMRLKPNHVYIGPSGGNLAVLSGVLQRMDAETKRAPHLPIDYFFRSLAEDQKDRAICIVLSGTGTDGTVGLKAIKGESGMAMVQQPQSAKYAGMPSSAIATGMADYVLPPAAMPPQLLAYASGPYLTHAPAAEPAPVPAEPMQKTFVLLRNRTGNDFSGYKGNTLRRRIERRMNIHQIHDPNQYVRYLQENPHEIDILFKELLISVTNFFRDPDAWDALTPHLESLIKSRPDNYTLRIWVPGCATGEEVFSLAIVLRECMERIKCHHDVQIFGTDLDAEAIESARVGQYPAGIAGDISPQRLDRYFIRDDSTFQIRQEIREMAIFAPQNVIKDPPFTKLDMLFCRNLLIYLNADLQKRLLPIFHYALKPDGLLFLGPSETVGAYSDLFLPLDKRWKIFRRQESAVVIQALPEIPAQAPAGDESRAVPPTAATPPRRERNINSLIERLLLGRFAPVTVVVNERGDIIYIHGRTGAYLEPAPGQPRNNVVEMAREGLQIELSAALRECVRKGADVTQESIRVKANGEYVHVDLTVSRITEPESVRGLLLITLRPTPPPPASVVVKRPDTKSGDGERIVQLERELQFLQESQQTIQEELETSNEELKSTNEELQSTNEELQSTNEELETSKEEMQSLNEELTTVNAELQSKVDDLSQANDDMQNLLNSTYIATVFLDNELNIKRFTEQAKELIMLRPTDVGRPISELASNLKYDDLVGQCRQVLKTLVYKEAEVESKTGANYLMRIMPYRTAENVIDGLVITFIDISRLKAGEKALAYFESIVATVREPLIVLDSDLRVVSANRAFYQMFQTSAEQTAGELVYQLSAGRWDNPKLRELLEEILPKDAVFEDYKVEIDLPTVGRREFVLNARQMEQSPPQKNLILLAMEETKTH